MSGRSTRSVLSTSIRRRPARREFVQAGLDQRALAGAAGAGQQHVVGAAAGDELLGVAQQALLLRPRPRPAQSSADRRDVAHRLDQRPSRRACGSGRRSRRSSRARPADAAAPLRGAPAAPRRARSGAAAKAAGHASAVQWRRQRGDAASLAPASRSAPRRRRPRTRGRRRRGRIGCMPVKAPNAGSTPTAVAEPEARQAQPVAARGRRRSTQGCRWPAST